LYENTNDGGRTAVSLELKADGSLRLFYHDRAKTAREMFGGSDYEAWLNVAAEAVPSLCFALLREVLSGKDDALTRAQELCHRNGVKHEPGVWT
jgi:hypothetical protein